MINKIRIGEKGIGAGEPTFIIAEIGSNHDGKLDQAKQLIDEAARIGADAVKFQSFRADYLVTPQQEAVYHAVKGCELPQEWHRQLAVYARERHIIFLSTAFDEESADLLFELGMPAFKVASGDLTHIPLLRHVARFQRPILLSTGMGTLGEVEEAIGVIQQEGNEEIVLLHCVSTYPSRIEDANLRAILTMREAFRLPVGSSDHTLGNAVPLGAVALGACLLEKHFTVDRTLTGPDHPHSMEVDEFESMIRDIRCLEVALGTGVKAPMAMELPERRWARRGLYARVDIPRGTAITREMLKVVRPCLGLEPRNLEQVVGRVARVDIPAHAPLTWESV